MKKTYSCGNSIAKAFQTSIKHDFNKEKSDLVALVKPTKAERKAKDQQLELGFKIYCDKFLKRKKNTHADNEFKALAKL